METKGFSETVLLGSRKDVLRLHLYFKLLQFGVKPRESDIDVIIELYLFGGYNGIGEQARFIDHCLQKRLRKSPQSLRNTFSKYVNMGIFEKPKNTVLHVSEKFIPKVEFDRLVLLYKISHAE